MKIRGQTVYPLQERLVRLSARNEVTGCLEWQSTTRNGYGRLIVGSRTDGTRHSVSAHRLSYEVNIGPVPDSLCVLHRCDNRPCIEPTHLFLGTQKENADDCIAKGRNAPPPCLKHDRHPNRKLNWQQVNEIRELASTTKHHLLAERFGVARRTISGIATFQNWIPEPPKPE
jgi:hypothetical protein